MALIQCPKCGNEISDKAVQCPYCGTYPEEHHRKLNICLPDKKKMITSGWVLIICIVMGSFIWIQTNEKNEQVANIKNIEKGAELLGKEAVDGKFECSAELDEFLNNVSLFGHTGKFTYNLTSNTTNNQIDCMVWTTECDNDEKEINEIIDKLCEIYGKYDEKEVEYADIERGYQWQDVDQYSWVFSGINKKNNEIEIYWFK